MANPQKFRYKLIAGAVHIDEAGKIYKKGDIVEADYDLSARFGRDKFQVVHDIPPASQIAKADLKQVQAAAEAGFAEATKASETPQSQENVPSGLDGLSVRELRALAEQRGIDISTCGNKSEILNTVREAIASS